MQVYPTGAVIARAIVLGGLVALAVFQLPVAAQEPNDITLRLTSTTGNPGDTVEVSVELVADDALPESFALFLAYDPAALQPEEDAYEIIARDEFTGEPILDNDGNTIADFNPVRLSEGAADAGKTAAHQIYTGPGAIGIVVLGINQNPIPAGELLTVAFRIRDDVPDGSMTDVIGVDEAAQIHVPNGQGGADQLISSFTRTVDNGGEPDVVLMTYDFENTAVIIGCIPVAAPTGVSATQDRSDGVLVSWSGVAGENVEYRVYRATVNNATAAVPIGAGWQSATSFLDITARVPEVTMGECLMPAEVSEVHYFYWVRARGMEGCEGDLSAQSAEGYRVQANAKQMASVLPQPADASRILVFALVVLGLGLAGRRARKSMEASARA